MAMQETEASRSTTYRIFGNGIPQPEYPGVSDESIYDSEKQIYVPRRIVDQITKPRRKTLLRT